MYWISVGAELGGGVGEYGGTSPGVMLVLALLFCLLLQ